MKNTTQATASIVEQAPVSKRKRGEVREDGRIFWRYKSDGYEVWVRPEKVAEVKAKEYARVKANAAKTKARKMPPAGERLKMGHVRSDGMIFWAYSPDGTEQWFTEDGMREKREKSKQAKKKCYEKNREKHLARSKKWREDNPEAAAASFKAS